MRLRENHAGFSAVELLIIVAVIAVLGLVGYTVYNRQNTKKDYAGTNQPMSTQPANKANDVGSAPSINSTDDLDKASATLDKTDPGGSNNTDASQLDAQLANF